MRDFQIMFWMQLAVSVTTLGCYIFEYDFWVLRRRKLIVFLFFPALRAEAPSTSTPQWVNQARVVPLLSPVCQFSAEATARGRSPSPPLPLQGEWAMVSTALPHPAPTPAPAAPGSAGAFSALRLSVSPPKGTAVLRSSPQT